MVEVLNSINGPIANHYILSQSQATAYFNTNSDDLIQKLKT